MIVFANIATTCAILGQKIEKLLAIENLRSAPKRHTRLLILPENYKTDMSTTSDKLYTLFEEWESRVDRDYVTDAFITDGIMFNSKIEDDTIENVWHNSRKRIMFLISGISQHGKQRTDEDLRLLLNNYSKKSDILENSTFRHFANLLWGFSKTTGNHICDYESIKRNLAKVEDYFQTQPFALVACKKTPGKGPLCERELKKHLRNYGDLLKREIKILSPNIIVCTNQYVYRSVINNVFPVDEQIWFYGLNQMRFHRKSGTLIFYSYKPQFSLREEEDSYYWIMGAYRYFLARQSEIFEHLHKMALGVFENLLNL